MVQVLRERGLKSAKMQYTEEGNEPLETVTVNCLSALGWQIGIQASYEEV